MAETGSRLIVGGELLLYGDVGGPSFFGEAFSAQEVRQALAEFGGGPLTVRINSGGGSVYQGIAIHTALKERGDITVKIDGIAASAASVFAMAGKEIVIAEGALMMVHNASGLTEGPKELHLQTAGVLGKIDGQAAGIYAERTGKGVAEVSEMMLAETWMTAEEAVAQGFADRSADGAAIEAAAFDYTLYRNPPRALAALVTARAWKGALAAAQSASLGTKGSTMTEKPKTSAENPADKKPDAPAMDAAAIDALVARAKEEGKKEEVTRITGIQAAVTAAKLEPAFAAKLVSDNVPLADARARVIDALAEKDKEQPGPKVNAVRGGDGLDRFKAGVTEALILKTGLGIKEGKRNEFSGYKLFELARMSLELRGHKTGHLNQLELAGAAFNPVMLGGMHSTSDFGTLLANVASKSMLKGWEEAEETFEAWTTRGTLTDFKPTNRVDLNLFPSLAEVVEGANYTYATMGDRGQTIQLATYGKLFAITRQALINDDVDAFGKIPMRMGRAAKRTIANLAYAVLTANAAMADTFALFSTQHANNSGSAAAPAVATVSAGRVAMAKQKDPDSHATGGLGIRPKFILVPLEYEDAARVLMASEFDPAQTQRVPNPVRGSLEVITDVRLSTSSGTNWYLAADPAVTDTIEVAYLDGQSEPFLDQQDGWTIDGTEFKVRIDAGVKALDFRGLYRNSTP